MDDKHILNEEQAKIFNEKLAELNEHLNTLTGHKWDMVTLLHVQHGDDSCPGVALVSTLPIGETGGIVAKALMTVRQHFIMAQAAFSTDGLTKQ